MMIALPLLVTTLALAPSDDSYRFDVYAAGHVDVMSAAEVPDYRYLGGRGGLGVTVYLRRLTDDDAPPSLQAYLQRTPMLHVDGGGGSWQESWSGPTAPRMSATQGWAGLDLSGYARWLYGAVHVGLDYSNLQATSFAPGVGTFESTDTSIAVPVDATVGVRWRDWRVTVGWGVTPTRDDSGGVQGDFKVPFWGAAHASVATVVRRRLWLEAGVLALEQGAGAFGDATIYLKRRFGINALLKGGHQAHTDDTSFATTTTTLDYVGFGLGAVVWASSNVFADLRYDFEWDNHGTGGSFGPTSTVTTYYNTIQLGIGFRR
jgi:hypothetical protein